MRATRAYYTEHKGEIPEGLALDHLCRNRKCVNPDHLEPVTNAENTRRGVTAKLTMADVHEIREAISRGEMGKTLAMKYGVSASAISLIVRRKHWVAA